VGAQTKGAPLFSRSFGSAQDDSAGYAEAKKTHTLICEVATVPLPSLLIKVHSYYPDRVQRRGISHCWPMRSLACVQDYSDGRNASNPELLHR